MNVRFATISKTGKRDNNEDAFNVIVDKEHDGWMGIVCDGMGGHAMGEVASETIVNSISKYWKNHNTIADSEEKIKEVRAEASSALDKRAKSLGVSEMGTTMVMASIQGNMLTVAHIGDSRCYVQRPSEGLLYQTKDHTKLDDGYEVVTQCFFSFWQDIAVPAIKQIQLQPGDRILLCSDGLYKSMPPTILTSRMMDETKLDRILDVFDSLCEKSGDDNYTAILIEVE